MYKSNVAFTDFLEKRLNHDPYRHFTSVLKWLYYLGFHAIYTTRFPIVVSFFFLTSFLIILLLHPSCCECSSKLLHWKIIIRNESQAIVMYRQFCLTRMLSCCRYGSLKRHQQCVWSSSFLHVRLEPPSPSFSPAPSSLWVCALPFPHPTPRVNWPYSFLPCSGGSLLCLFLLVLLSPVPNH